jgi:hypothetical protein
MPDADTLITADDVIANVDNNNTFGNDNYFSVEGHGGGITKRCMWIDEFGNVYLKGALQQASPLVFNCSTAGGDPSEFVANGTLRAKIDSVGHADFSAGSINLPVLGSTPNGVRTGSAGDCVIWNNGGTFRFMVCQGGTTWNKG